MDISQFFMKGDIKGAIEYMKQHEEYKDVLPLYIDIFENCNYRKYEIEDKLNQILLQYQIYYRDIFYCRLALKAAEDKLKLSLCQQVYLRENDEDMLVEALTSLFKSYGYQSQFGKTQGYYGPYIWKKTITKTYDVKLPDSQQKYTINILQGFIYRGWMDYLTFSRFGTAGWASKDGTINCVEQAYDFESERFLVSFLKHEAQHTVDMKKYENITETELEYRAKLVVLCYCNDEKLLQKFIQEADETRENDSHGLASAKIKKEFSDTDKPNISFIQNRALQLFKISSAEMNEKYSHS